MYNKYQEYIYEPTSEWPPIVPFASCINLQNTYMYVNKLKIPSWWSTADACLCGVDSYNGCDILYMYVCMLVGVHIFSELLAEYSRI